MKVLDSNGVVDLVFRLRNHFQEKLITGTNIKSVNNIELLGRGNISVQPTLVSGSNIKTINGNSLLGNGNMTIRTGVVNAFSSIMTPDIGLIATGADTLNLAQGNGITITSNNSTNTITIASSNNTEAVELTQAEYNALTTAEKNNGTVYFITDGDPTPTSLADIFVSKVQPMVALDTTATEGTDKEIYDALVSLGWDSDVIV